MKKRFQWIILSAVVFELTACNSHLPTSIGAGSTVTGIRDGVKTYTLPGQFGYSHGQVMRNSQGLIINSLVAPANQTYYFDFDSTIVRPVDLQAIHIQANYLVTYPKAKVRLEGNTDNRGSREYNIGLGWRRDQAVAHILEQEGVAPSQINMVSYGKEHPVVLGENRSSNNNYAWRLNRRVNLIYEAY
ncbi:MAG: OmpA family protein [Coxiella endosymbiont of Dermacentor nuttalli]